MRHNAGRASNRTAVYRESPIIELGVLLLDSYPITTQPYIEHTVISCHELAADRRVVNPESKGAPQFWTGAGLNLHLRASVLGKRRTALLNTCTTPLLNNGSVVALPPLLFHCLIPQANPWYIRAWKENFCIEPYALG